MRSRTDTGKALLALGRPPMRSCWRLRSPASPLPAHLGEVVALEVVYGGNGVAALERALISHGLAAGDVREHRWRPGRPNGC